MCNASRVCKRLCVRVCRSVCVREAVRDLCAHLYVCFRWPVPACVQDLSVHSLLCLLEGKAPLALPSFPALGTFHKRTANRCVCSERAVKLR